MSESGIDVACIKIPVLRWILSNQMFTDIDRLQIQDLAHLLEGVDPCAVAQDYRLHSQMLQRRRMLFEEMVPIAERCINIVHCNAFEVWPHRVSYDLVQPSRIIWFEPVKGYY